MRIHRQNSSVQYSGAVIQRAPVPPARTPLTYSANLVSAHHRAVIHPAAPAVLVGPATCVARHPGRHRTAPVSWSDGGSRRWARRHPLLTGGEQVIGITPHHLWTDAVVAHILRHPVAQISAPLSIAGLARVCAEPLLAGRLHRGELISRGDRTRVPREKKAKRHGTGYYQNCDHQ